MLEIKTILSPLFLFSRFSAEQTKTVSKQYIICLVMNNLSQCMLVISPHPSTCYYASNNLDGEKKKRGGGEFAWMTLQVNLLSSACLNKFFHPIKIILRFWIVAQTWKNMPHKIKLLPVKLHCLGAAGAVYKLLWVMLTQPQPRCFF